MSGLDNLNARLNYRGGTQEHRMQNDKLHSFHMALQYSYQAADVTFNNTSYRALINPDKLKQDYDDKIISIDYAANLHQGDIFYWVNTQTYWLVTLENLEEDAYFRGDIRRCRYTIKYKLDDTEYSTYAAVRGPVETKIVHNLKSDVTWDSPNYTLYLLLPNNAQTKEYFVRYNKFMLGGVCWQIQAVDEFSMQGVIELTAQKYFKDEYKDTDEVINGKVEPIPTDPGTITGEQILQIYNQYTYTVPEGTGVKWTSEGNNGYVKTVSATKDQIVLEAVKAGDFTLKNGTCSKPLRIESLF